MGAVAAATAVSSAVGGGLMGAAAGTVAAAAVGAGEGALMSTVTGGDPGQGALGGAITGGIGGGLGGAAGSLVGDIAPGLSSATQNAIGYGVTGALGGGLAGAATGTNPLMGAAIGGVGGAIGGYMRTPSDTQSLGSLSSTANALNAGYNVSANGDIVNPASGEVIGNVNDPSSLSGGLNGYTGAAASTEELAKQAGSTVAGAAGASKGLSDTSLALGALSAAGSLLNKPQVNYQTPGPSSTAATQGPMFNQPLASGSNIGTNRTAVTPSNLNTMTYGQNPAGEQSFFTNNYLTMPYGTATQPSAANAVQANAAANAHLAHGGALSRALHGGGHDDGDPATGPVFTSTHGAHLVHGGGDGASDSINAKLSRDEYVLRADEVAAIGHGSAAAGAEKLDKWRDWLARETGKKNRNSDAKGGDGALSKLSKMVDGRK